MKPLLPALALALLLTPHAPVRGQEPTFSEAGTHPGGGQHYSRVLLYDSALHLKHAYGLTGRRALTADLRLAPDGIPAATLRLKQRIWQHDTGPINTWRASLQAGIDWRETRDPAPRIGLVSTTIRGRHGLNAQIDLNAAAPNPERIALNASHAYRLHPARYAADTPGAWYTLLETLNTLSPDNSNIRADLAAGLLYEARRWAAELSLRHTHDNTLHLALGLRLLW